MQTNRIDKLFQKSPLKKFLIIEIPADAEPQTAATIAELVEAATRVLRKLNDKPVRTMFVCAENLESLRSELCE